MNIAFAGFRHSHIFGLYNTAVENPDVNIVGCYENDASARKNAEENYNIVFNYPSYEDILNDKKVEAIAIGDYYGTRGQMVIDALKAEKHVICDKPICTDLDELKTIETLARKNDLKVCCMLDLRYMPQVSKVCELIKNGEIGDVLNVSFTGQHCLDYGNRPMWYFEDGKHGGTINDIAIHGIDLVRHITQKNLTKINCAKTWNAFAKEEPSFKDCGQFMVEMDDVSLIADVSYAAPKFSGILPTYWDFYFWGTDGMINFRICENVIHLFMSSEEIIECEDCKDNYLEDLVDEIMGKTLKFGTMDTIESQKQVLLIQKSANK